MAIAGALPRPKRWTITGLLQKKPQRTQPATGDAQEAVRSVFSVLSVGLKRKGLKWAGRTLRAHSPQELAPALVTHASDHANVQKVIAVIGHTRSWLGKNPHVDYIVPQLLKNSPWTFGHIEAWKNAAKRDRWVLHTALNTEDALVASRALHIVESLGEIVAREALQAALKKQGTQGRLAQAIQAIPRSSWTKKFLEPDFNPEESMRKKLWAMGQG